MAATLTPETHHDVPADGAINMAGPYLACEATCPRCQYPNLLVHVESHASDVKPVDICPHLRAVGRNEDGSIFLRFAAQ